MKGIWEKINNQQENAELLEDNFNEIKREDFFSNVELLWNPKIPSNQKGRN
jgi:hypothetical protein